MRSRQTHFPIKRIYEPTDAGDGTRVLVDRLWPRGVTKQEANIALWLKDIAPSPALRKWFGHDPGRWSEFRRRYREELRNNTVAVAQIHELAKDAPVTLVYAAHDPLHNQALALAEYLEGNSGADHVDLAE